MPGGNKKRRDIEQGRVRAEGNLSNARDTQNAFVSQGARADSLIAAGLGLVNPQVAAQGAAVNAGGFNPQAYLQAHPDVAQYYAANREALARENGITSAAQFADFHYKNFGQAEGRSPGVRPAAQPVQQQAATAAANPAANPATNPLQSAFEASPFYTGAQNAFANHRGAIDAGFAGQGMAFSGARAQAAENAAQDRYNQNYLNFYKALQNEAQEGFAGAGNQMNAFGQQAGLNFDAGRARADTRQGFLNTLGQIVQVGGNVASKVVGF